MVKTFILDRYGNPLNADFNSLEDQEYFKEVIKYNRYTLHLEVFLGGVPIKMTSYKECYMRHHLPRKVTAEDIRGLTISIAHGCGSIPFFVAAPIRAHIDNSYGLEFTHYRPFKNNFYDEGAASRDSNSILHELEKQITIDEKNIIVRLIYSLTEDNSSLFNRWLESLETLVNRHFA